MIQEGSDRRTENTNYVRTLIIVNCYTKRISTTTYYKKKTELYFISSSEFSCMMLIQLFQINFECVPCVPWHTSNKLINTTGCPSSLLDDFDT